MISIFLSYRRVDSLDETRRLKEILESLFGKTCVFRDEESIPSGADFRDSIEHAFYDCDLMVVVIGDRWLNATTESGRRRLDDPNDYVRKEIETAFQSEEPIPVVPILIRDAKVPAPDELPKNISGLSFRNAVRWAGDGNEADETDRLCRDIVRHLLCQDGPMLARHPTDEMPAWIALKEDTNGWVITARSILSSVGNGCGSSAFLFVVMTFFSAVSACGILPMWLDDLFVSKTIIGHILFAIFFLVFFAIFSLVPAGVAMSMVLWFYSRIFGRTEVCVQNGDAIVREGAPLFRQIQRFPWACVLRIEPHTGEIGIVIQASQQSKIHRTLKIGQTLPDDERWFLFWYLRGRTNDR